jgi:hypothetical protein
VNLAPIDPATAAVTQIIEAGIWLAFSIPGMPNTL